MSEDNTISQDNSTQTTTLPEEVGNIIPSVPQEQTTQSTTIEQTTQLPTQEETIGEPVFNTP